MQILCLRNNESVACSERVFRRREIKTLDLFMLYVKYCFQDQF
jgi:hypothetical protein